MRGILIVIILSLIGCGISLSFATMSLFIATLNLNLSSLAILEIHFPSCCMGTQCPKIKPLHISENGVFMLLDRMYVSKSSGPGKLPRRLQQCLATEITPVVYYIFTQSLCTGELPTEWTQANMLHLFLRKAVSYRQ